MDSGSATATFVDTIPPQEEQDHDHQPTGGDRQKGEAPLLNAVTPRLMPEGQGRSRWCIHLVRTVLDETRGAIMAHRGEDGQIPQVRKGPLVDQRDHHHPLTTSVEMEVGPIAFIPSDGDLQSIRRENAQIDLDRSIRWILKALHARSPHSNR